MSFLTPDSGNDQRSAHPPMLLIEHLAFAYPGEPPLISGWSARLTAGVLSLRGESGSGKSTLLRLLAGTLPASGGTLTLTGISLAAEPAAYRRQVFWRDPAEPGDDALMPAAIAAGLRAEHASFDEPAWLRHLEGFGLAPHLGKPLFALSTGSRRKVWLSAALAAGCPLTLLDEPTAGLDAASIAYLGRALAAAGERGIVILAGGEFDASHAHRVLDLPLRF